MPYCGNCGAQLILNAKFCGNCGAVQTQTPQANSPPQYVPPYNPQPQQRAPYYAPPTGASPPLPPPPPQYQAQPVQSQQPNMQQASSMPQAGSEQIYGAILLRKPKSLGRWDTWTGVITSQRFIFAQMTEAMIKVAVQQSRDQAKAEGKGFWGQWADQLKATWGYTRKYLSMQPQAILAETPGNFAVDNGCISEIKVKLKYEQDSNVVHELELKIHSNMGNFDFHIDENSETIDLLKRVYNGRVKMPLGYFSKSINIKF